MISRNLAALSIVTASLIAGCFPVAAQQNQSDEDHPIEVKAGEPVKFTIHIDPPPESGGRIMFAPPVFGTIMSSSGDFNTTFCAMTVAGQTDYECLALTPKIQGNFDRAISTAEVVYPDNRIVNLNFKPIPFHFIGLPPPRITNQTVQVTLTPSSQQLLRTENVKLQTQLAALRAGVRSAGANTGALAVLLQNNIRTAVTSLQTTQREFKSGTTDAQFRTDSDVFFSDLQQSYDSALRQVNGPTRAANGMNSMFLLASQTTPSKDQAGYPAIAQATIRAFEQNELAYRTVADADSLYFDLEADSSPAGAKVSYFREGDKPEAYQDPTNCTIHSLVYAIWTIRFEMPGYRTEERDHNPFTDPNHILRVELQK